jgi:hypothetical protein
VVEPELFASLRPPTYNGRLLSNEEIGNDSDRATNYNLNRIDDVSVPGAVAGSAPVGFAGGLGGRTGATRAKMVRQGGGNAINPRQGVHSSAVASQLGDYFEYLIDNPVTLQRQKSAMLPIVGQEVEGAKVSIYNEATHAKFPLLGLKFKNTTKLHLMQGPITVFENNSYAGDARILDLQPKEERLLSYAIDLGTEVEPVGQDARDRIIKIKIAKGLLEATHKVREGKTYTVKNRSDQDRTLLIEHPYRPEFKLLTPEKFSERARDVYRFELKVPAGQTAKLDVIEERDIARQVAINGSDDQTVRFFLSQPVSSDKVKAALQQAIALRGKLASTLDQLGHKARRLVDIQGDQARLRENLKTVPQGSEAYKRYVKKFDDQETEIEQLQEQIKKLQETEFQQRQGFDSYLGSLDVE